MVICASHHEVLEHWLAAAEEGRIPRSGVHVVHVDAHPDLAVPLQPIQRGWPADPILIERRVGIASFQLAAVWTGLVERIVWLRPDGSNQLPDGERTFRLGQIENGLLRVDDESDYYVFDDGYAPTAALRDSLPVQLRVLPIRLGHTQAPLTDAPTILDIDLDAFATRSPPADRLRDVGFADADLDALRSVFDPDTLALPDDPDERVAHVDAMLAALEDLATLRVSTAPGALFTLWRSGLGPSDFLALYRVLRNAPDSAAVQALLEDGRNFIGLPERETTPAEILEMAGAIGALVSSGAVRPQLITIARSVGDGFTPHRDWPAIEWTLLSALQRSLGTLQVRLDRGLQPAPRPPALP